MYCPHFAINKGTYFLSVGCNKKLTFGLCDFLYKKRAKTKIIFIIPIRTYKPYGNTVRFKCAETKINAI